MTCTGQTYRQDLQGLRALGALLVACFHIFQLGVSGGVDVFFVVAGFFLWTRFDAAAGAAPSAWKHWAGFVSKNMPQALMVLGVAALLCYFLLPPAQWPAQLKNLASSALYLHNYWLIVENQDYLARGGASIVQNFWALSVIAQVYLVWPLVFAAGRLLARVAGMPGRAATLRVLAGLSAASFIWSVSRVSADPEAAYFDTLARFWQFGAGAFAAAFAARTRPGAGAGNALSWLGLALVLSCGPLLGQMDFPGIASVWPSAGAALVLIFGTGSRRGNAGAVLAARPLVWLGGLSYGFYLWHWPLYILYLPYTNGAGVGIAGGAAIIALSVALAWGSAAVLRTAAMGMVLNRNAPGRVLALVIGFAVTMQVTERLIALDHPLMATLRHPLTGQSLAQALLLEHDLPVIYTRGCVQKPDRAEVLSCTLGPEQGTSSFYLVGGSHSAHWLPALAKAAGERDARVVVLVKSACRFFDPSSALASEFSDSCVAWNRGVLDRILKDRPDHVVTLLTEPHDETPEGFLAAFAILRDHGIGVIALRDVPVMGYDASACVTRPFSSGYARCRVSRDRALNDALFARTLGALPAGIDVMDMTDQICDDEHCDAVRDGMLIWRDADHLTSSYVEHLGDVFARRLSVIVDRPAR